MKSIYHKNANELSYDDLNLLIDNRIQENKYLIFIEGNKFELNDKYMKRFARDLTAMANTGGGMIIAGIRSERKKAAYYTPVSEQPVRTDLICHYIISNADPFPKGLEVNNIEIPGKGYCIAASIPKSETPVMFSDYRYYGFKEQKAVKLDAPAVNALFNTPENEKLEIFSIYNTQGIPEMKNGKYTSVRFYPNILLKNTGQHMVRDYKLEVKIPSDLSEGNSFMGNRLSHYEGKYSVFSFSGREIIFGGETKKMLEFVIIVNPGNIESFESEDMQLKLYYPGGVHEQSFALKEIFTYKGKMLEQKDFAKIEK